MNFWERVQIHFNAHRPSNTPERPARSLETKWHTIKHDVSNFFGHYGAMLSLNESGTSSEDTLHKALEMYKTKHPKHQAFTFIDCWLILRDVPRWMDAREETKRVTPIKRSLATSDSHEDNSGTHVEGDTSNILVASRGVVRPQGSKAAKEFHKRSKLQEISSLIQARATESMVAATLLKAQVLQDQNLMALFSLDEGQINERGREFFQLRQEEELAKLKRRLQFKDGSIAVTPTRMVQSSPGLDVEEDAQEDVQEPGVGHSRHAMHPGQSSDNCPGQVNELSDSSDDLT